MDETNHGDVTRPGPLLRRLRLEIGLTQGALADKAGVGIRTIQDLELGTHQPRQKTVQQLVRALGLSADVAASVQAVAGPRPRRSPRVLISPTSSTRLSHLPSRRNGAPSEVASRSNLPAEWSTVVGRESELRDIAGLVGRARLVTLTGAGGVGKSRLALAAARAAIGTFGDGVWLVELAALKDQQFVVGAVLNALGLEDQPNRPPIARLVNRLRAGHELLVLDNCEHVVDACADLIHAVLGRCPNVSILATSREALRLTGENVYRVPSLPFPGPDEAVEVVDLARYGATRLFAGLAREGAGFTATKANVGAVARICRDLDGIPLAIELAAARLGALTVEQIADHLGQQVRFLAVGHRAALPRQQTMRATIDWSYNLLTETERCLWRHLSVFAGGFTLEAAEAVGAEVQMRAVQAYSPKAKRPAPGPPYVLDLVSRLVDKSLVVREDCDRNARYRLLEPLRQYALEKLTEAGEEDTARERHVDWCVALTARLDAEIYGPNEVEAAERISLELANLRSALAWCVERDPLLGLRLARSLGLFWGAWGLDPEGQRWRQALLARTNEDTPERAHALFATGMVAKDFGDYSTALARLREAQLLAAKVGDHHTLGVTLMILGGYYLEQGDHAEAKCCLDDSLRVSRAHSIQIVAANALYSLSRLACIAGDYVQARAFLDEYAADKWVQSHPIFATCELSLSASLAQATGEPVRAIALLQECVARLRAFVDRPTLGLALADLGYLTGLVGDYRPAELLLREALALFHQLGHSPRAARALLFMGLVAIRAGGHRRGTTLVAAAEATPGFYPAGLHSSERSDRDERLAESRLSLGEAVFDAAWAQGRAMTFEQAVAFGLATEKASEMTAR